MTGREFSSQDFALLKSMHSPAMCSVERTTVNTQAAAEAPIQSVKDPQDACVLHLLVRQRDYGIDRLPQVLQSHRNAPILRITACGHKCGLNGPDAACPAFEDVVRYLVVKIVQQESPDRSPPAEVSEQGFTEQARPSSFYITRGR